MSASEADVERVAQILGQHWEAEPSHHVADWHPEDQAIYRDTTYTLWRSYTERHEVIHAARLRRAARAILADPTA